MDSSSIFLASVTLRAGSTQKRQQVNAEQADRAAETKLDQALLSSSLSAKVFDVVYTPFYSSAFSLTFSLALT